MINSLLYQQCSCVDALSFFFGFNDLEVQLYFYLVQQDQKIVAQLCKAFDRNQSTIYTALEKLVSHGVVTKTKRNRQTRGYEYIYGAVDPQNIRDMLRKRLDLLYSKINSCLDTFDSDAQTCEITEQS